MSDPAVRRVIAIDLTAASTTAIQLEQNAAGLRALGQAQAETVLENGIISAGRLSQALKKIRGQLSGPIGPVCLSIPASLCRMQILPANLKDPNLQSSLKEELASGSGLPAGSQALATFIVGAGGDADRLDGDLEFGDTPALCAILPASIASVLSEAAREAGLPLTHLVPSFAAILNSLLIPYRHVCATGSFLVLTRRGEGPDADLSLFNEGRLQSITSVRTASLAAAVREAAQSVSRIKCLFVEPGLPAEPFSSLLRPEFDFAIHAWDPSRGILDLRPPAPAAAALGSAFSLLAAGAIQLNFLADAVSRGPRDRERFQARLSYALVAILALLVLDGSRTARAVAEKQTVLLRDASTLKSLQSESLRASNTLVHATADFDRAGRLKKFAAARASLPGMIEAIRQCAGPGIQLTRIHIHPRTRPANSFRPVSTAVPGPNGKGGREGFVVSIEGQDLGDSTAVESFIHRLNTEPALKSIWQGTTPTRLKNNYFLPAPGSKTNLLAFFSLESSLREDLFP